MVAWQIAGDHERVMSEMKMDRAIEGPEEELGDVDEQ